MSANLKELTFSQKIFTTLSTKGVEFQNNRCINEQVGSTKSSVQTSSWDNLYTAHFTDSCQGS